MIRWLILILPLCPLGCAGNHANLADAFPPGASASPWILTGDVWTGTFEQAAPALGDEAETWRPLRPTTAWLAIYHHQQTPARTLTARCFAFPSTKAARHAYDVLAPLDAKPFQAGNVGCWTELGVLFQQDRLVFDIFGPNPSWSNELQAAVLAAHITKRIPAGLPQDPR